MSEKEAYIDFCAHTPELPLFLQPWWLDAVTCPDHKEWEVLLARNKKGEIEAVMPFVTGRKWGLRYVVTPQLTQYTGVWIKDIEGETATEHLSREKRLQNDLIAQLEAKKIAFFDLKFPLTYTYWSPFFWAGYRQETHYTYQLPDLHDIEAVYQQIDAVKRRHIRAAEKELEVRFDMSSQDFYRLQCMQLGTKQQSNVASETLVTQPYFIPYDKHAAYELISAIHPDHRTSGGSVLALWHAIKKASEVTKAFDFEGSMIEGVEHNNRQFGGIPVPYYEIYKKNKLIQLIELCKK